jgi:hypothetical protein
MRLMLIFYILRKFYGEINMYFPDMYYHAIFNVSVLTSGTQVCGFKPGRSRRIFKDGKILSTPSFGREVKIPKCTVEVGI